MARCALRGHAPPRLRLPAPWHALRASRARRARRSSSTARSGMVRRKVAPMVPSTRRISPPWARTSSAAMARPRPGAAGAGRALERLEQMRARRARKPGAGVGHLDHHHRALAPAGDADLVAAGIAARAALQRLHRVAREIEQDAEQLVGVGVDHQAALDRADPAHRRAARRARASRARPRPAARARPARRSGGGSCTRP